MVTYEQERCSFSGEFKVALERIRELKGLENKAVELLADAMDNAAVRICSKLTRSH